MNNRVVLNSMKEVLSQGEGVSQVHARTVRRGTDTQSEALSASRAWSRSRTSSGVSAARCRWSRAMTTPVAATPASPARPNHFHTLTR